MKKRSINMLTVLTVFIAVLCLTSCTDKKSVSATGEKPVEILFWTFHTNQEFDFMELIAREYEKVNPQVKIKVQGIPSGDYQTTALTTAFASNSGPDVFLMSPGDFLKYVNSGIAMDLTPYFTQKIRDDFLRSSIDAVTVNDKIYAIPFEVELLGLYYNAEMLQAAQVAVPKTWTELVEATKKLTQGTVSGLIIEPNQGYYQNFVWYPFLWQGGGNVINNAAKKSTFDSKSTTNALKLWSELIKAGAPSKITVSGTSDISPLGLGQTAMQICGTWAIPTIEQDYPTIPIALAPIPIPDAGGKAATCAGGWKFMVNSKSEHADETAKFIMWAFAENIELPYKWCTEVKFAYSPRKSVVELGESFYDKGLRKVFTNEIYNTAIGEPRYPAEIVTYVGDALQSVMFTNTDPATAAKKADTEINTFLKTFNGSL